MQIEIDRALYMDERRIRPNARYGAFKTLLRRVIADIAVIVDDGNVGYLRHGKSFSVKLAPYYIPF